MPYAEVGDIRMYYEEQGSGEPLLLLHGATGAISLAGSGWSALAPAFAERYRAIQIEHRGHGRTDNPSGRIGYEQVAADIAAFIELRGLAPAHVAGVSDGGIIGLALGMARPELVASLVLVGANYRVDEQVAEANAFLDADLIEREHPGFVRALADAHDTHHHPGYWRELVARCRANADASPEFTEADLAGISAPTLLISGETDLWANLDQMIAMRRAIPDAELLILNRAGMDPMANHIVQLTRADVVGPVVLDFLGRHPVGATGAQEGPAQP